MPMVVSGRLYASPSALVTAPVSRSDFCGHRLDTAPRGHCGGHLREGQEKRRAAREPEARRDRAVRSGEGSPQREEESACGARLL